MNLWDRLKTIGAAICLLTFVACEDPTQLGQNLQDLKDIEIRYAEIPLEAGMIRVDSVNTTNRGFLMVGKLDDPIFGKISASSYTNLAYVPGDSIDEELVYDSISLVVYLNEFTSKDEDTQFGLEVRELTNSFLPDYTYLSNSEAIPYASQVIGSKELTILNKHSDTTINIKLDKTWGAKFDNFLRYINASDTSFTQEEFNEIVSKGIAILPKDLDGMVRINSNLGTSSIHVYYHKFILKNNVVKDTSFSDFAFYLNYLKVPSEITKGFTKIEVDRSSASLNIADEVQESEFFQSIDGKVYNSNLTGILPVLNFSNIYSFLDTIDNMVVNRADIVLEENNNSLIDRETRPNFLMYWAENPIKIDFLKTVQTSTSNPLGTSSPSNLSYIDDQVYYTDVTTTIQALFDKTISYNNIVLSNSYRLVSTEMYQPLNNLSRTEINNIKIRVYYTVTLNK